MNIHNEFHVQIRFYEELNDFIKKYPLKIPIRFTFRGKRSVKDLIESFGVPHTEVDLILVNRKSVNFSYLVQDNDDISVYPMFERFDIRGLSRLREIPLRDTRFILDVHLGKLVRRLRLLGFDTDYDPYRTGPDLARISREERRILLTCNRALLMRKIVTRGLIIRHSQVLEQTAEVLNKLSLWERTAPFSRCINCNGFLKTVPPEGEKLKEVLLSVPNGVSSWCRDYSRCTRCGRIYWKGSHFETMRLMIEELTKLRTSK